MKITITPAKMSVKATSQKTQISTGIPVVKEFIERPTYEGAYEITPSEETQTLPTNGLRMTDNVVINPIPSNYGLITWDGTVITVS